MTNPAPNFALLLHQYGFPFLSGVAATMHDNTIKHPTPVQTTGLLADPYPRDGLYEAQYVVPVDTGRGSLCATAIRLEFTESRVSEAARADILRYVEHRMASELPPVARPRLTVLR